MINSTTWICLIQIKSSRSKLYQAQQHVLLEFPQHLWISLSLESSMRQPSHQLIQSWKVIEFKSRVTVSALPCPGSCILNLMLRESSSGWYKGHPKSVGHGGRRNTTDGYPLENSHRYWKSPSSKGKSSFFGKSSIAMLNYQRIEAKRMIINFSGLS